MAVRIKDKDGRTPVLEITYLPDERAFDLELLPHTESYDYIVVDAEELKNTIRLLEEQE